MNLVNKKFNFLIPVINRNLIRLGVNKDGGYVVESQIVKKADMLISFGIGYDWSFELDFLKKNNKAGINIYDYTTNIFPYLKNLFKILRRVLTLRSNLRNLIISFLSLKNYLDFKYNKKIRIYFERVSKKKIHKYDIDIKNIFKRINNKKKNIILKIDIEESEYEIISDVIVFKDKISMIIIEFHNIEKNISVFRDKILKLKEYFEIIHLHGNNHGKINKYYFPDILEITLVRKNDLYKNKKYKLSFPDKKVDYPNNPNKDDIKFMFKP